MAERLFIRKLNDYYWQWRVLGSDNYWTDIAGAGDLEQMLTELENVSEPACLILPGCQTVIEAVPVDVKEKNHLAKLVPYEMEEDIVEPIDELHFAFGNIVNGKVLTSYTQLEVVENALEDCAKLHCDVQQIFPDYLFLRSEENCLSLIVDNNFLIARFADGRGVAIEEDLSEIILYKLASEIPVPARITLIAADEDQMKRLRSALPGAWTGDGSDDVATKMEKELEDELQEAELDELAAFEEELDNEISDDLALNNGQPRIIEEYGDFWQWMDLGVLMSPLNMRRGKFGRQLPIERWWAMWKFPSYVAAAAFVLSFGMAFGDYLAAKSEGTEIKKQIEKVYLTAAPDGRRGDEERRLESLLKKSGGGDGKSSQPSNLMVILAGLSKAMEKQSDIKLNNFRYNGDQKELQLNLLVNGLDDLGKFKDLLAEHGLETGSPRTSAQGQAYQASMKVTEKTL